MESVEELCDNIALIDPLDYLAIEFMERGWDVKWLVREIVTSRVWQLAAGREPRDPDNRLLWRQNRLRLTAEGQARVAVWPADPHPLLGHPQHRTATVELALAALHLLHRDRDYVLRDGQVLLVDEATGRAAEGRAWSRGLHQLVELKEGVPRTGRNSTVIQLTFQQFFVRYLKLAGSSGDRHYALKVDAAGNVPKSIEAFVEIPLPADVVPVEADTDVEAAHGEVHARLQPEALQAAELVAREVLRSLSAGAHARGVRL